MYPSLRMLIIALGAVLATHAIAYLVLSAFPEAAVRLAGILGGSEISVDAIRDRIDQQPYWERLLGLFVGDFGKNVDGVSVLQTLLVDLGYTLPRLMAVLVLVVTAMLATLRAHETHKVPSAILDFLCTIPPFVYAFIFLGPLIVFSNTLDSTFGSSSWIACVVASAIAPSALVSAQSARVMGKILESDYASFLRSMGVRKQELQKFLLRDAFIQLIPTLEKTILWSLLSLIFSELILSLPGLGLSLVAALSRADISAVLAVVIVFAFVTNAARFGFSFFSGTREDARMGSRAGNRW